MPRLSLILSFHTDPTLTQTFLERHQAVIGVSYDTFYKQCNREKQENHHNSLLYSMDLCCAEK